MSDLFDVRKEIILVTGASQGLGRQFARVLAAHGAAVVLAARQTAKLKSLEEEIRGKGGRAAAVQMDVTDIASIGKALDTAEAAFGPVSVLINNAGIAIEKLSTDQTEADWDAVINANLKGAYFLATEMARRMIARKQEGNIVNVASVLGTAVMKFLSPYAISKAGIMQATKAMALELAGNRIRVNALAPGYIDTEMNHDFWATPAGEKLTKRIPQRRVGAESDLDGAILLLGLERFALHDRQRGNRRRRVFAELACPHLAPDHVGGLLADHDGRRIGVAADQGRHDRGIDHAQALEPVNLQLRIDHGHRVVDAHLAGADRVIDGVDVLAQGFPDIGIALDACGEDIGGLQRLQRGCVKQPFRHLEAGDHGIEVGFLAQEIWIDRGRGERIGALQPDAAMALRAQQADVT